jgi:hypothetical protein
MFLYRIIAIIIMVGLVVLGIYLYERTCYLGLRPAECGDTLLFQPKVISSLQ